MAHNNVERFPIGRTALGGASCGFTYDGAIQDAVAREKGLRRLLRLTEWQRASRSGTFADAAQKESEPERSVPSA